MALVNKVRILLSIALLKHSVDLFCPIQQHLNQDGRWW